eukprot:TRINITY_DN3013_c0_g1_i1.p1 TRINITY_DN3013_c0_g1~~TRINITY_DN3013_c0_g1_i1.p1  ORF type:complete len:532 (+),score=59.79 TRINITY_DN3013_c0_g1_i1:593-2188(+)
MNDIGQVQAHLERLKAQQAQKAHDFFNRMQSSIPDIAQVPLYRCAVPFGDRTDLIICDDPATWSEYYFSRPIYGEVLSEQNKYAYQAVPRGENPAVVFDNVRAMDPRPGGRDFVFEVMVYDRTDPALAPVLSGIRDSTHGESYFPTSADIDPILNQLHDMTAIIDENGASPQQVRQWRYDIADRLEMLGLDDLADLVRPASDSDSISPSSASESEEFSSDAISETSSVSEEMNQEDAELQTQEVPSPNAGDSLITFRSVLQTVRATEEGDICVRAPSSAVQPLSADIPLCGECGKPLYESGRVVDTPYLFCSWCGTRLGNSANPSFPTDVSPPEQATSARRLGQLPADVYIFEMLKLRKPISPLCAISDLGMIPKLKLEFFQKHAQMSTLLVYDNETMPETLDRVRKADGFCWSLRGVAFAPRLGLWAAKFRRYPCFSEKTLLRKTIWFDAPRNSLPEFLASTQFGTTRYVVCYEIVSKLNYAFRPVQLIALRVRLVMPVATSLEPEAPRTPSWFAMRLFPSLITHFDQCS